MTLAAASLLGCNLADGLTDVAGSLGDPDAALIDNPGRRVATGRFYGLDIDGSLADGGQVVALEETEDGTQLAIIPYLGGESCRFGPALGFDRLSSRVDVELPGILAVQQTRDEANPALGRISFVNFQCEEVLDGLEMSRLSRSVFPSSTPRGVLMHSETKDGELFLIEPAKGEKTLVASDTMAFEVSGDKLWTLESGGQLVVRKANLEIVAKMGKGIPSASHFLVGAGTGLSAVYIDEDGLHAYSEEAGEVFVEDEACGLTSLGPDVVGYTGCSDNRLVLLLAGKLLSSAAPFIKLVGPQFVSPASVAATWRSKQGPAQLLYLVPGHDQEEPPGWLQGDLHLAELLEEDIARNDEQPTLVQHQFFGRRIERDISYVQGRYFEDYDGRQGSLMELEQDDDGSVVGLVRIAKDVAKVEGSSPFSSRGIVTDVEDGLGTLRFLRRSRDEIEEFVVARDVPTSQAQVVETETERVAFLGNSKDGVLGSLLLTSGRNPRRDTTREISKRFLRNTARFLSTPRALAYLHLGEDGSAALRTWLLDAELELTIHRRVSEYRPVPWPAPGILYAVPDGKDQGLWYAKAR